MFSCMESGRAHKMMHVHVTSWGREYVEVEMRPIAGDAG